jgi:hypothetical protein
MELAGFQPIPFPSESKNIGTVLYYMTVAMKMWSRCDTEPREGMSVYHSITMFPEFAMLSVKECCRAFAYICAKRDGQPREPLNCLKALQKPGRKGKNPYAKYEKQYAEYSNQYAKYANYSKKYTEYAKI